MILRKEAHQWNSPIVTLLAKTSKDPFKVLISCILSLRTQDSTTAGASKRLFALASSPQEMLGLMPGEIEEAIYPVGFYHTKAKNILGICRSIQDQCGGVVPSDITELVQLKGVGRKTANLVVTLGYGKPGICVDTHVHRITNRWGYVRTAKPNETEFALRRKLPRQYWIEFNNLLVSFGQHLCRPISPFCDSCPIERFCDQRGVRKRRGILGK